MAGNWLFFPLFGNAANWQSQQMPSHWVLPGTSQAPKGPASTLLAEDPRHPLEVADCIACTCPCPPSWVRGSGRSAWMGFGSINRDSACEPGQVGQHVEKQAVGLCLRVKARLPWGGTWLRACELGLVTELFCALIASIWKASCWEDYKQLSDLQRTVGDDFIEVWAAWE